MIKIKGQVYEVSMLKAWLPDKVLDNLEYIRDFTGLKNNIETLCHIINSHKGLIDQFRQMKENDGTANLVPEESKEDKQPEIKS